MKPEDIRNIKINENTFDYKTMYEKCKIDLSKTLERPPIAMGIGYHSYKGKQYLNPTFTYGEMSMIIAPQKTKKTFFSTALQASYIGGQSANYFPNMVTNRQGDKYVISFDTEQGEFYAQRAALRVNQMVGEDYPYYLSFGLKQLTDDERVEFIDHVINDPRYKGKIGWVSIDGIADLCENTNDIEKSKRVAQKLMQWNSQGFHLCGVLHKTFEKDRGTGHLGSFAQKKSETVIFLRNTDTENKNGAIEVKQKDSRGAPFDDFHFLLDDYTILPKLIEESEIPF